MCVVSCSRCVGVALVPLALLCILANSLLFFPWLEGRYLLEGHVTREATYGTGLWASGFLVLVGARGFIIGSSKTGCCGFRTEMLFQVGSSCVALTAAALCCLVSASALVHGPLCLHNSTQGQAWASPFRRTSSQDPVYLYAPALWDSACEEPRSAVLWHVVLFSVLAASSALQALLCAAHTLNSICGVVFGRGFCRNKVSPVSV
ncbi:transmembrane 4 L6 family member 1 [Hypomesus transpacificus]|uniref:transmembrane 4 L6 family member 1 n=1 Tax=Hypomesus transpacificus TaxID=137520 RepID=UPI001F07D08C|nr:transmembrane 4 L6 family member 1 [Hypomesus transpacificus]